MTREEQIKKYCQKYCDTRGFTSDGGFDIYSPMAIVAADAIKWADEHPKSPWIKFRDRRPDIMCLVLVYHDEEAFTAYFKEFDDGLYWRSNIGLVPVLDDDYWMLIPKLEEE